MNTYINRHLLHLLVAPQWILSLYFPFFMKIDSLSCEDNQCLLKKLYHYELMNLNKLSRFDRLQCLSLSKFHLSSLWLVEPLGWLLNPSDVTFEVSDSFFATFY